MDRKVDVLAVMAVAAPHYPPLNEARAAVAELIEAASAKSITDTFNCVGPVQREREFKRLRKILARLSP